MRKATASLLMLVSIAGQSTLFGIVTAADANQSAILACVNETHGGTFTTFAASDTLKECREQAFGTQFSNSTYVEASVQRSSFTDWSVLETCGEFFPNTTLRVSDLFDGAFPVMFDTDGSGESQPVQFDVRDATTGLATSFAVADARLGSVTFLGNVENDTVLELWATDGLGREVIVWRYLITPVVRTLTWDRVHQFTPPSSMSGNQNITYEFWDASAGPVRTQWALQRTYNIAPIAFEGLRLSTDNTSVDTDTVSFIVEPNPPGFFIDSSTGEILGVPRLSPDGSAFNETVFIFVSYDGILTAIQAIHFEYLPSDETDITNGPNELGCLNGGDVVDDVEFDKNFTCACPGVYVGDNCEEVLQGASTGSSTDSSSVTTIAIVSSIAGLLLILFIALGAKRAKMYMKSRTPHDFADDVSELDRLGLTSADGPVMPAELKRSRVKIVGDKILGKGEFGIVVKAQVASSEFGTDFDVAVKVLKTDPSADEQNELVREAFITAQFTHPNVISLVGVVTVGRPMLVVLQFCEKGSLKSLLEKEGDSLDSADLAFFCRGIVDGMTYLSGRKFLHRDLAARNVLVDSANVPKVADFGLSRDLEDSEYYRSDDANAKIPLRWTAPEAIKMRYYSEASDVWAFGVTCIEIYTRGATPYRGWMNSYVLERVEEGYRLPQPEGCPSDIYEKVIYPCFDLDPNFRPTFAALKAEMYDATATLKSKRSDALISNLSGQNDSDTLRSIASIQSTVSPGSSGYVPMSPRSSGYANLDSEGNRYGPASPTTSGKPGYDMATRKTDTGSDYRDAAHHYAYEYAQDASKVKSESKLYVLQKDKDKKAKVYYEAPGQMVINNTGYVNQEVVEQSATSF